MLSNFCRMPLSDRHYAEDLLNKRQTDALWIVAGSTTRSLRGHEIRQCMVSEPLTNASLSRNHRNWFWTSCSGFGIIFCFAFILSFSNRYLWLQKTKRWKRNPKKRRFRKKSWSSSLRRELTCRSHPNISVLLLLTNSNMKNKNLFTYQKWKVRAWMHTKISSWLKSVSFFLRLVFLSPTAPKDRAHAASNAASGSAKIFFCPQTREHWLSGASQQENCTFFDPILLKKCWVLPPTSGTHLLYFCGTGPTGLICFQVCQSKVFMKLSTPLKGLNAGAHRINKKTKTTEAGLPFDFSEVVYCWSEAFIHFPVILFRCCLLREQACW